MGPVIFWFRSDLRLHDQPALQAAQDLAIESGRGLLPVFCLPDAAQTTPWGFARWGVRRRAALVTTLRDLARQLQALNCPLLIVPGPAAQTLPRIARTFGDRGACDIVCEDIAAPWEQDEIAALRAAGLAVRTVWHSSLLHPDDLPWPVAEMPTVFTAFRQSVEREGLQPRAPLPPPVALPPWPTAAARLAPDLCVDEQAGLDAWVGAPVRTWLADEPRSSLPGAGSVEGFDGGESAGLRHLSQYLARRLPDSYKRTRNGLMGVDFSSKWSPWLAPGALSPRRVLAELRQYEAAHGASDGSYWLWFELLWRDHFRWIHCQQGRRLYRAQGLAAAPPEIRHNALGFERWCQGRTGQPLVDAAMRELAATGFLSNRLRQAVASYLIHDLGGDWRAGAAWFESQLVDFDVYSNQGNWLYIAGRGTDPRGGRRFNLEKQAAEHDPQGVYQQRWGTVTR